MLRRLLGSHESAPRPGRQEGCRLGNARRSDCGLHDGARRRHFHGGKAGCRKRAHRSAESENRRLGRTAVDRGNLRHGFLCEPCALEHVGQQARNLLRRCAGGGAHPRHEGWWSHHCDCRSELAQVDRFVRDHDQRTIIAAHLSGSLGGGLRSSLSGGLGSSLSGGLGGRGRVPRIREEANPSGCRSRSGCRRASPGLRRRRLRKLRSRSSRRSRGSRFARTMWL